MKLINSRGRVILEVISATAQGIDKRGFYGVLYARKTRTAMRLVSLCNLNQAIDYAKSNNPGAKLVGFLPEPKLKGGANEAQ